MLYTDSNHCIIIKCPSKYLVLALPRKKKNFLAHVPDVVGNQFSCGIHLIVLNNMYLNICIG